MTEVLLFFFFFFVDEPVEARDDTRNVRSRGTMLPAALDDEEATNTSRALVDADLDLFFPVVFRLLLLLLGARNVVARTICDVPLTLVVV